MYVLVIDADDTDLRTVAETFVKEPVNGIYSYSVDVNNSFLKQGKAPGRFIVIAGSDTDNDDSLCNKGEACGVYPVLGNAPTIIEPRTVTIPSIDFFVSPFGGITAASVSNGQADGFRRLKRTPVTPDSNVPNKSKPETTQ